MTRTLRRAALVPALALVALTAACSDDGGDAPEPSATSAAPTSAAPTSAAPTSAAPTSAAPTSAAPSSAAPSSAAPTTSTGSGSRGLGEDAAEALAARIGPAINLRASDLPGFTATPDDGEDSDLPPALLSRAATCLGLSDDEAEDFLSPDDDEAEVSSPDLERGEDLPSLTYSSTVSVDDEGGVRRPGFQRKYDVVFSDRGAQCVGQLFAAAVKSGIGDPSATVRVVSSTLLVVPRQAGQVTGGLDVRMEALAGGERVAFNLVLALQFQGDTQVSFVAAGAGQQVPSAQREALLRTLSTRLAAAAS